MIFEIFAGIALIITALAVLIKILNQGRCQHNFEIIDTKNRHDANGFRDLIYVSQCQKCGKIQTKGCMK